MKTATPTYDESVATDKRAGGKSGMDVRGPLGPLPALSRTARRSLVVIGVLSLCRAAGLVAQAFLLAAVLAGIVTRGTADGLVLLGWLAGVIVARGLVDWAIQVVSARAAADTKEELRGRILDHTLAHGPEWIMRRGAAKLTSLATRGLDSLDSYFTEYLPALVTAVVVPVAAGGAVLLADWPSAVVIALTVPLLPAFAVLIGKYTTDRVGAATDSVHRMSDQLLELVRALPVLSAFGRAGRQAKTVRRTSERHRRANLETLRVAFSSAFVLELAAMLSVALVAVVIGVRLASGDMALALGLGVLILAPECYQPLRAVGSAFHSSEDGVEALRRTEHLLTDPVEEQGAGRPAPGPVRVRRLRVRRRGGHAPDGVSFTVRPGETVRLDDPSGAGKTTTLGVLLGFVSPASGSVTVNNTPLNEVDLSTWRDSVAWVPQVPGFTGDTVRGELATAVPDGDHSGVLAELGVPEVLDQPVDELSAGQRQRVAVARALLKLRAGAWLLLADEPAAHLDPAAAALVDTALRRAAADGAAVIIAAHTVESSQYEMSTPCLDVHTPAVDTSGDSWTRTRLLPLRGLLRGRLLAGAGLGAAALLAGIALTATSAWLIAKASFEPPILMLTVAVVGVRTFGLGRASLRYLERLVTHDGAFRVADRLRVALWQALVRLGPARARVLRGGEGQRRLVDDVDTIRDLLPRALTPPIVVGVVASGAVLVQTLVLPAAGMVLLAVVVCGGVLAPLLSLRLERRATAALTEGRRDIAARVFELVDGAAELLAFGTHRERRARLARADARLAGMARRQAFGSGAATALLTLSLGGAALVSTWLAGRAVVAGQLAPVLAPVVALVPLALVETLALLPPVAQHWDPLRSARARLGTLLSAPADDPAEHDVERLRERGTLSITAAGVGWPGATEPVLRDVDVRLGHGEWCAVVGPSGAGKSTLLAAMLGVLPVENGQTRLPWPVAWAPQDPRLVSTTVAENLRMADPHADDAALSRVLRQVALPELTLDTRLTDAGAGLSGGQAQRVALARALLAVPDAELVLLDEPTAHLDEVTAREVLAELATALAGKTVVHVTHRAHEAARADVTLDVRRGTVTSTRQPAVPVG